MYDIYIIFVPSMILHKYNKICMETNDDNDAVACSNALNTE